MKTLPFSKDWSGFERLALRFGVWLFPDPYIPRNEVWEMPNKPGLLLAHPDTFQSIRTQLKFDAWMDREERR